MNGRHDLHLLGVLVLVLLTACSTLRPTAPTAIPTPASFPTRSPLAFENPDQLGLGSKMDVVCRCYLPYRIPASLLYAAGIKEFKDSTHPDALIPWFKFLENNNFGFGSSDNTQFVEGASVLLKDAGSQAAFDDLFIAKFPGLEQQSLGELAPAVTEMQGVAVGDKSIGVSAEPTVDGVAWHFDAVSFRLGEVGAYVFDLYPAAGPAPDDILKVAQIYADSLKQ